MKYVLPALMALLFTLTHSASAGKELRFLSLDGGGSRGAMTHLEFLRKLEERTGLTPQKQFDGFAGTSMGGIFASGLARGYSYEKFEEVVVERLPGVFHTDLIYKVESMGGWMCSKYKATALEETLKDFLGEDTMLSDIQDHLLLLVTQDASHDEQKVITNWLARAPWDPKAPVVKKYDARLWEVTRGTSAAPTYFPPIEVEFKDGTKYVLEDGGLSENDPAGVALDYAMGILRNGKLKLEGQVLEARIYSAGTGDFREKRTFEELEHASTFSQIPLILHQALGTTRVNQSLTRRLEPRQYYRWNPSFPLKDNQLDNTSSDYLARIRKESRASLNQWKRLGPMCHDLSTPRSCLW